MNPKYPLLWWMTFIKCLLIFVFPCIPALLKAVEKDPFFCERNPKLDTIQIPPGNADFLGRILKENPGGFSEIITNPDEYKLQVIYTRIDRDRYNKPSFQDFSFNMDPDAYFYPASTVKLPVALLALQKLKEINIQGVDKFTTMLTGADFSGQSPVFNDPTTYNGSPSVAHYIKKIFLVSDNDAYNRLYEFLGPEYINTELQKKGYSEAQIIHRLSIALSEEENRHTNPVTFYDSKGKKLYSQAGRNYTRPFAKRNDKIGKGYLKGGNLMEGPLDFSIKNRLGLLSLHNMLKAVIFPEAIPAPQRFNISPDDYRFVKQYMSQLPRETDYPSYDTVNYYDTYCKFLLFGADKNEKIPPHLKIYNKVGDAYGFLLDVAYIMDAKSGVEFILSAVIYCNSDGILNDDRYEYEELGFPFMKHIGRVLYEYEKTRKKKYLPKPLQNTIR